MKLLIFSMFVIAVHCVADPSARNKTGNCVTAWKYHAFENKRNCLRFYVEHAIKQFNVTPATATTIATPTTTLNTSIAALNSSLTSNHTNPTVSSRRKRDAPAVDPTHGVPASPSLPDNGTTAPEPLELEEHCSSFDKVKNFFSQKWVYYTTKYNMSEKVDIEAYESNKIRTDIFNTALLDSKLAAFEKDDFVCIKARKENITNECVMKKLTLYATKENITKRTSDVMSKSKVIYLNDKTCSLSKTVGDCVTTVLSGCSPTVRKFVEDLRNVTSQRCKIILAHEIIPDQKRMSTVAIVFTVLGCIVGAGAVAIGLRKFLIKLRNSGLHTVTRTREEHEMSPRNKSVN